MCLIYGVVAALSALKRHLTSFGFFAHFPWWFYSVRILTFFDARRPSFVGHVYLFFSSPFLYSQHAADFCLFVASYVKFICPHGSRRSFVFFFFFFLFSVLYFCSSQS